MTSRKIATSQKMASRNTNPVASVTISGFIVRPGDRVRLWPRKQADIMDMALRGKVAIVEAIEKDYDDHLHLAVVLEDDPGRDLGMMRQPGHRFFFSPEEVEPELLNAQGARMTAYAHGRIMTNGLILVAGVGNIFLGDDAFGVEVVQRLADRAMPPNVRVVDFGIRSYDLAYALMDPWELVILVDAVPGGDEPGTVYLIEPDLPCGRRIARGLRLRCPRHESRRRAAARQHPGRQGEPPDGGRLRALNRRCRCRR